ncbi:hypothetical protein EDB84DRAFT_1569183 [Lactarius hengduanensis]|nr:hypothetical protein EDB84DRAFT_1569183 [Lactarius hengduanensis]
MSYTCCGSPAPTSRKRVSEMSAFLSTSFLKRGSRTSAPLSASPADSLRSASRVIQLVELDAIATALFDPSIFDLTNFKSESTLISQAPLFELLRTFLSGGLDKRAWKQIRAPPGIQQVSATQAGHPR